MQVTRALPRKKFISSRKRGSPKSKITLSSYTTTVANFDVPKEKHTLKRLRKWGKMTNNGGKWRTRTR